MSFRIPTSFENGESSTEVFRKKPDTCPLCRKGVDARFIYAYCENKGGFRAYVVYQCPMNECHNLFFGQYTRYDDRYSRVSVYPHYTKKRIFSDEIMNVSESFVDIFNEAYQAEQEGLQQICGAGYRKALEFIIKDYAILLALDAETQEEIKKSWLGTVISTHIPNQQIQDVSKRASWLGNDETHYVRKWGELDLTHLKTLIELTVRWIEMEEKTKLFIEKMPE